MEGEPEEQEDPICPVCGRPVKRSNVTITIRDVSLHPECLRQYLSVRRNGKEARET
jgi:hypothetical protein